jgi:hypothetical protein
MKKTISSSVIVSNPCAGSRRGGAPQAPQELQRELQPEMRHMAGAEQADALQDAR